LTAAIASGLGCGWGERTGEAKVRRRMTWEPRLRYGGQIGSDNRLMETVPKKEKNNKK